MPKVYMVRHGRAAANFTSDLDPGLDDLGRDQAVQAASVLVYDFIWLFFAFCQSSFKSSPS